MEQSEEEHGCRRKTKPNDYQPGSH